VIKNKPTSKLHWSQLSLEEQITFHEERSLNALDVSEPHFHVQDTDGTQEIIVSRRRRGEHSTKCLCPEPVYFRPESFKKLPGEIGHAYSRLVVTDRKTGRTELRIRLANHPVFRQLREAVGRKRGFYAIRRQLINHIFPLLVSSTDLATCLITLNISQLATQLSTKDEDGNIVERVTQYRVCRLIKELLKFGVLEAVEDGDVIKWDSFNRKRFPTHVAISDLGWRIIGIDVEKLRRQRQERLDAEYEGLVAPGEQITVRAARKRWLEQMRHKTLISRREAAVKNKLQRKLRPQPFDERMAAIADHLARSMPYSERYSMPPDEFEKLCYNRLRQLDLALHQESHSPPH
jgi:hypothetical protein